jgi:hypothetical protein
MLRGPHLIRWETLIGIVLLFGISILPETYFERFEKSRPVEWIYKMKPIYNLYDLWRKRRMRRVGGDRSDIYQLIHNLRRYYELQCRDPRDRIYALLTISGDVEKLNIQPDYSDSTTADLLAIQLTASLFKLKSYQPHCLQILPGVCC